VIPADRPPIAWWPDVVLLAGFAGLTLVLAAGWLLGPDVAVAHWVDGHRPAPLFHLARAGNRLGQGAVLTGIAGVLAGVLAVRHRSVRPLLPVVAAFALTFGTLTLLKLLTERPAPHATVPHPERFGQGGASYPSGHLVNAIVWYGVLALLLQPWLTASRGRLLVLVPTVILAVTTVYLGYHWLTDTVAGILLGLLLFRLLRRIPWDVCRITGETSR
jgi:membrane-associated phospholipid phosphatase